MGITYQLTKKEFIRMNSIYARHINKISKYLIWFYYFVGVGLIVDSLYNITIIWTALTLFFSEMYGYGLMMLGELLLGVFFLVVGYYSSIWTAKRWAKKEINQKAFEKLDLTISDEGFYIANDRKELSTINWESVGNIYETKEFFLFEFVERQISTLPKRVLSAEQQQALIALIQQHFSGAIQSVNK